MKYIPGDLVEYQGKIYKITNSGDYYQISTFKDKRLEETELHPVKLTPQILEKNGWKPTFYTLTGQHAYRRQNMILWYGRGEKYFTEAQYCTQLKYIHELQHFLLGLGLGSEIKIEET